jgi:hypothetical protein
MMNAISLSTMKTCASAAADHPGDLEVRRPLDCGDNMITISPLLAILASASMVFATGRSGYCPPGETMMMARRIGADDLQVIQVRDRRSGRPPGCPLGSAP